MSRTKHHINLKRRQAMQTLPADYRCMLNKNEKAKVKHALRNGYYDSLPKFKQDGLYYYL